MNRNLYPTLSDEDSSNENVSSIEQEEDIPVLEEEEPEIPIFPDVPIMNKTKRMIKLPTSSEEKREFVLIKNKKNILNQQIELAKENFKSFISKYKTLTGKKPSELSKEEKEKIFGKSIELQKSLEEKLKNVEAEEEEFKRKYKERRTRGGRRHRDRRGVHITTFKRLFFKKRNITKNKKRTNKKRKSTRKYKNKKY